MAKILITGGSGLIGRAISELLIQHGDEPRWLCRQAISPKGIKTFKWDVSKQTIDLAAFEGMDSVIHLAGAGIVDKRWTPAYKKEIIASRVKSSELLFDTITQHAIKLKTCIGASAIGFYNSSSSGVCDESSMPGNDFLAQTCVAWEKSYLPFIHSGVRTVVVRIGIVLSKNGGAYAKMSPAFRMGLGAATGSGKHYFPWIHINDLAAIFVHALKTETLSGIYNAVTSESITNLYFSQQLAKSFKRSLFLPNIPEFILKLVLGERAQSITRGSGVSNHKIKETGFVFEYDNLQKALNHLK